ncbi:class I adenylate-forming enzyme family protein [Alicyclobacillus pomorum]|uniref:class I adenylate-forming enzyme family protein n=1 Tax=Alicyclobacillus pomorum TaxID=204470 RepID=UPI00040ECE85|nr:long-chain fatty acid--CoA ligase [Alicyclobacillus pomorum]
MPSIGQILERNARRVPDRTALVFEDKRYTYADLDATVNRAAHAIARLGVHKGDRVALMSPNSDHFIIAYYALLKLGTIVVPTNVRLTAPELAYQLEDSGARLILYDPSLVTVVQSATESTDVQSFCLSPHDDRPNLSTALLCENPEPPEVLVREEDDAQILYTSGTTGRPKGVLLDHHRVIWTGLNISIGVGLREGDSLLHVAPLYHSAELDLFLMGGTYMAATHVVLREFHPTKVLKMLASHRITAFFGVPTMYQFMLREPLLQQLDLSAWRVGMFGAAPMPPSTVTALSEALPHLVLYNLAGLTEMGPGGVFLGGEELRRHPGAAGRPILNTEARVVNPAFKDVAPGEVGELVLRGETLMKGYWNNPEATRQAIRDGWLLTGDLATVDEHGLITLVDRKKDMIITGGMNVYSVEVENAVLTHPSVADCAVIGVPHPDYGETVTAIVHLHPGATLTLKGLREHCQPLIADYKIPRKLLLRPIPRNASGKVLKYQLRQEFAGAEV